jgi:hypothetical protein
MKTDPKTAAARAFVRSLNILLKFARLYGYDHLRTNEQLQIAWSELRTAVPEDSEQCLLLGSTGNQLLLDGVPLEGAPEKLFAQMLSSAGLASVQFSRAVTESELAKFVHAFPTGKSKPSDLAQQLKAAIADARGIRVNEVWFVATDSRLKEASMAAQIAAASLGSDEQDQFKRMLNDPQKLLELIAAAQGTGEEGLGGGTEGTTATWQESGGSSGSVGGGAGGESGSGEGFEKVERSESGSARGMEQGAAGIGTTNGRAFGAGTGFQRAAGEKGTQRGVDEPDDEEIYRILRALTTFGRMSTGDNTAGAAVEFQNQVAQMPTSAQITLRDALAGIAEQGRHAKLNQGALVQLAEHLSIRFALERFERGEVKVNAVRQMLDRMNHEVEALRKILGEHEDKMAAAGILVESHRETLDRLFWSAVPENAKREVLLSEEAWCIPPKNIYSYVINLMKQGNAAEAANILQNYATCVDSEDPDARKRAATGLSELAELYAKTDPKLLSGALRHIGWRLSVEQDHDLHFMALDVLHPELIQPETGAALPWREGERGELVLTHVSRECQPLVRFRTGDIVLLTRTGPCACGRTAPRFRVVGRSDDMVVVRGINAFPAQVAAVVNRHDALSGEYRIVLDGPGPYDALPVEAELAEGLPAAAPAGLAETLAAAIKRDLGLGARVTLLPFGTLPRTEGKSRRVIRKDRP